MRAVAWAAEDGPRLEFAEVTIADGRLGAAGVAIGAEPLPHRLDYVLVTGPGFVTVHLHVTARGEGWRRTLDLRRDDGGTWSARAEADGEAPLPPPGGPIERLEGALDCDLARSPLTNSMPVLRHGLLAGGGPIDLRMAWVSVPDLGVRPSGQRYTFVRAGGDRPVVRYESTDSDFRADLTFDADGLVVDYPGLAHRLAP